MRNISCTFALLATLLSSHVLAGATIDLSAEATLPAANDLVRATVYAEANGSDPAELARRVNQDISEALRLIRSQTGIIVKSGQQQTYPVYGNNRRIESWRMHSELQLESKDTAALSALLGRLQQMKLALGQVSQLPSDATRRAVEEAATQEAIKAFERRAGVIASTLGKSYRIKQMSVQQAGQQMPVMAMRASRAVMMAADAAPAPLETGESTLSVNISGQIELAD